MAGLGLVLEDSECSKAMPVRSKVGNSILFSAWCLADSMSPSGEAKHEMCHTENLTLT